MLMMMVVLLLRIEPRTEAIDDPGRGEWFPAALIMVFTAGLLLNGSMRPMRELWNVVEGYKKGRESVLVSSANLFPDFMMKSP